MRLLRHEMGHVLNHAYLLEKDKGWQKLFGQRPWNTLRAFALGPTAGALSPPRRLLRAEPPRRGFRRDFRDLAHSQSRLAPSISGVEGAAKNRIR